MVISIEFQVQEHLLSGCFGLCDELPSTQLLDYMEHIQTVPSDLKSQITEAVHSIYTIMIESIISRVQSDDGTSLYSNPSMIYYNNDSKNILYSYWNYFKILYERNTITYE